MKHAVFMTLLLAVAIATIEAQPTTSSQTQETCDAVKDELTALKTLRNAANVDASAVRNKAQEIAILDQKMGCLVAAYVNMRTPRRLLLDDLTHAIQHLEASRTDKQAGSTTGAGGTTSVVSSGAIAKVLSFATEYGALTQSINQQTVTLNGNLAGLPTALIENGLLHACLPGNPTKAHCISDGALRILSRFSFGFSFDTSRNTNATATPQDANASAVPSTTTPVVFSAHQNEISQVTGRVELWNKRDYTSTDFLKKWRDQIGSKLSESIHDLKVAGGNLIDILRRYSGYEPWYRATAQALATSSIDDLEAIWNDRLNALVTELETSSPDFAPAAKAAYDDYSKFFTKQQQFLDDLAKGTIVAAEYTNNRPLGQTSTSNFRLIVDLPFSQKWKFTANGAVTIYDSIPATAQGRLKRFRDAPAAAELSYSLGSNAITGPAALSLAGYYQDQRTAAVLNVDPTNPILGVTFVGLPANAQTVLAQTGNIELVQLKLSVTPSGSSLKVPLAVSYSNRTDLINKPTWRAQIGLTYNFDGFFTK